MDIYVCREEKLANIMPPPHSSTTGDGLMATLSLLPIACHDEALMEMGKFPCSVSPFSGRASLDARRSVALGVRSGAKRESKRRTRVETTNAGRCPAAKLHGASIRLEKSLSISPMIAMTLPIAHAASVAPAWDTSGPADVSLPIVVAGCQLPCRY
ncbi:MAG: hypothetical protein QGH60_17330 [Phycisphaerae bacterium]|jgi:hypothetical protein|nr:hypothetical protein [Phycisphaerae bacterium]